MCPGKFVVDRVLVSRGLETCAFFASLSVYLPGKLVATVRLLSLAVNGHYMRNAGSVCAFLIILPWLLSITTGMSPHLHSQSVLDDEQS